ncbi:MAG: phosphatase PAP2 family protein [Clostridiales bacterium]|nr:phosphatase PAP2 family protein [Clostridiales bacterium]
MAAGLLAAFAAWTIAVQHVDVQPIGPQGSQVGFAAVNQLVHRLTGTNFTLYVITDWLGCIPVLVCGGFGVLGLVQWVRRRSIARVDFSILVLGGFYMAVMAAYVLFEVYAVNARPVLIDGRLETSYPSSTTMLVLCVIPTAVMQLRGRVRNVRCRVWITWGGAVFAVLMVTGRLLSGVHWLTDIAGGALLSAGLVMLYSAVCCLEKKQAQT